MTVLELVKISLAENRVRHNTEANYKFVGQHYQKEDFGKKTN